MALQCKSCGARLQPANLCSVLENQDVLCVNCAEDVKEELGFTEVAHWMILVRDVHPETAALNMSQGEPPEEEAPQDFRRVLSKLDLALSVLDRVCKDESLVREINMRDDLEYPDLFTARVALQGALGDLRGRP